MNCQQKDQILEASLFGLISCHFSCASKFDCYGCKSTFSHKIDVMRSDLLGIDGSLRSQHTGSRDGSIYDEDFSMHKRSSSSSSCSTISAGPKGGKKGANESAKRLKIGTKPELHAVQEQLSPVACGSSPTPPERLLLDAFELDISNEVLEGSIGNSPLGLRRTNSRFRDLRDFQRDDDFSVELIEMKRSIIR